MLNKEGLKTVVSDLAAITAEEWDYFESRLEYKIIEKKEVLLQRGQVENYLSFINKGAVRIFVPRPRQDLTFGFLFENEFVSAYDSFLKRTPSDYTISTLAPTSVWQISYDDLQDVYNNTQIGDLIGRKMAEKMFLIKAKREIALLGKTASQRYSDLFAERPRLIKDIPLQYIASYLGVSRESLSRIRKEKF
jgi:CRP-like cAMP-binding protein